MEVINYIKEDKFEEITIIESYLFGLINIKKVFRLYKVKFGSDIIMQYKESNKYERISMLGRYFEIKDLIITQR